LKQIVFGININWDNKKYLKKLYKRFGLVYEEWPIWCITVAKLNTLRSVLNDIKSEDVLVQQQSKILYGSLVQFFNLKP
jgi:hypothetical protein